MDKNESYKFIEKFISANTAEILRSQLTVALGASMLFKKDNSGTVTQVKDPDTIMAYLRDELDGDKDFYYYIMTEKPDTRAIDSMLDRLHGKATQKIAGDANGDPIRIEGIDITFANAAPAPAVPNEDIG